MKHCVSIKSEAFRQIANESGMHPIVLAAKMGVWMDKNDSQEWPTLEQLNISDNINYILKSIELLSSDNAKNLFLKGKKNNWSLDKILSELNIPKEQKQLILDLGLTSREEIAIELGSNYGYNIQIKTSSIEGSDYNRARDNVYEDTDIPLGTPEFENAVQEELKKQNSNTSYYSNLTSPGGTNYRELEISTPDITPSIKGHAKFATDKGIGWFRVDTKLEGFNIVKNEDYVKDFPFSQEENRETNQIGGIESKTLRVLELQSDLFQKGRDKEELVKNKNPKSVTTTEGGIDANYYEAPINYKVVKRGDNRYSAEATVNYMDEGNELAYSKEAGHDFDSFKEFNNIIDAYSYLDELRDKIKKIQSTTKDSPGNKFLQLLNKDGNWITFFIKSLIQHATKEGYEKVWFPRGETAAKIEGHETIADEINKKDGRIEYLKGLESKNNETEYGDIIDEKFSSMSDIQNEISKVEKEKSELKTHGIEKLKPIEGFYEVKVKNIFDKQFGKENVTSVTDEYGNGWYEIDLNSDRIMDVTSRVSLSKNINEKFNILPISDAKDAYKYYNLLNKDGSVKEARTEEQKAAMKKWYDSMKDKAFIGMILRDQAGYSRIYLTDSKGSIDDFDPNRRMPSSPIDTGANLSVEDRLELNIDSLDTQTSFIDQLFPSQSKVSNPLSKHALRVFDKIAEKMSDRFGIQFKIVSSEEGTEVYNKLSSEKVESISDMGTRGFYDRSNGVAYLIDGHFDASVKIHEIFGHPFLDMLKRNPELRHIYNSLALQAVKSDSNLKMVSENYEEDTDDSKLDELILGVMGDYTDGQVLSPSWNKVISKYFEQFTKFITELFNKAFNIKQLRGDATIEQIADWVLYGTGKINLLGGSQRKATGEQIDSILSKFSGSELSNYNEGKITFNEAIYFNDKITQSLVEDWTSEHGSFDSEYIRKGILSDLASINEKNRKIIGPNGEAVATFKTEETRNGLIVSNININKESGFTNGMAVKSLIQLLKNHENQDLLIKVGDYKGLYKELQEVMQEDAIYEKTINGESYLSLNDEQNIVANKVSMSKKSVMRAAAQAAIPTIGTTISSMPTELEIVTSSTNNLLHSMNIGLKSNLQILERSKTADLNTLDEIRKLIKNINSVDSTTAAINFVEFAYRDVLKASDKVLSMVEKMNDKEDLSYEDIMFTKRDFIPLYENTMKSIHSIMSMKDVSIFNSLPSSSLKDLTHQVLEVNKLVSEIDRNVNLLLNYEYKKMLSDIADEVGSPTMKELLKNVGVAPSDLPALGVFFGRVSSKKSEQLRALSYLVNNIQSNIIREVETDGILGGLADSFLKLKGQKGTTYKEFMEHVDGKATGYMTSDLLRGKFNKDVDDFRKSLAKQYGLKNAYDIPIDPVDVKKYNDALDDFLTENAERMFTPEYYHAKKQLSQEASEALNSIKENIASFSMSFKNSDGILDTRMMTPSDINKFKELKREKKNLSSLVNLDGSEKMAGTIERKIADDIIEFYKSTGRGLGFSVKNDLFNQTWNEVKSTMSADEANRWFDNNTKIEYDQKFWDQLEAIERQPQMPTYDALYAIRKSLLDIYKDPDTLEIPASRLESITLPGGGTIADKIKDIDIALSNAKIPSAKKIGPEFKDIAEITPTNEYRKALRAAVSEEILHPGTLAAFDRRTSYTDANGYRQLHSYWNKLEPKDKNLIKNVPNSIWAEMNPDSEFLNKKFDVEKSESGLIPKRSKYDNHVAFDKLMSNPLKKDFYDKLKHAYSKANSNYSYIQRPSPYRLAQIPGSFLERAVKGDTFLSGFREAIKDEFRIRPYDMIAGDYDTRHAYRSDGTKVRFVPTKFRNMLEDRDSISRDLLGSFAEYYKQSVNYKLMSAQADKIETMLYGIKETEIKDVKSGVIKGAGQSNMYQRAANFVSSSVYGDEMANDYSVKFKNFAKEKQLSQGKETPDYYSASIVKPYRRLINLIRKINLSANVRAITTNLSGSQVNLKAEATCGIWMNNAGYRKGQAEVLRSLPSALTTNLTGYSHNKLISVMRMMGIAKHQMEDMANLGGATFGKSILGGIHYGPFSAGDYATKGAMVVAVMSNFRPYNGKFYSRERFIKEFFPANRTNGELVFDAIDENMYDAFEIKDNVLSIKPKYDGILTDSSINYARAVAADLARKLDGTLTDADKGKLHSDVFASTFFLHRGWMQVAIEDRFATRKYDYNKQAMTSGDYTEIGTSAKILMNFLAEKIGEMSRLELENTLKMQMGEMKNKYDADQLYNFRKTATDFKWLLIASAAAIFASGFVGDSDDDKKRSLAMFIYTLLLRNVMELGSVRSPVDAYGLIQSPTAAEPAFTQIGDIFGGIFDGTLNDRIEEGRYQYYTKLERGAIKLTPGVKNIFESFIKPDLKASEHYMRKNINITYNVMDYLYKPKGKGELKDKIDKLQNERFIKQMQLDKGENTYKPLFYEDTKEDDRLKRVNARKKARESRITNRKIRAVKRGN